jgi:hypothetical protein
MLEKVQTERKEDFYLPDRRYEADKMFPARRSFPNLSESITSTWQNTFPLVTREKFRKESCGISGGRQKT